MKIRWFKKLSREARHPSVEDLLLYLDGEAETKHAGEIKEHLERIHFPEPRTNGFRPRID